jgi:hypothetical protein
MLSEPIDGVVAPEAFWIVAMFAANAGEAGAPARGFLTTRSVYGPDGTARNVNAPFASVVVVALSKPESADRSSIPAGSMRTPVPATGPSGPVTVPETRTTGTGVS